MLAPANRTFGFCAFANPAPKSLRKKATGNLRYHEVHNCFTLEGDSMLYPKKQNQEWMKKKVWNPFSKKGPKEPFGCHFVKSHVFACQIGLIGSKISDLAFKNLTLTWIFVVAGHSLSWWSKNVAKYHLFTRTPVERLSVAVKVEKWKPKIHLYMSKFPCNLVLTNRLSSKLTRTTTKVCL